MEKVQTRPRQFRLHLYVGCVIALGAVLFATLWRGGEPNLGASLLAPFVFWLVFTLAAETLWLPTPTREGTVSMALTANLAVLYVLPLHLALSTACAGVLFGDLLLRRRGLLRAAFNAGQTCITLTAAGLAIRLLGNPADPAGSAVFLIYPCTTIVPLLVFPPLNTFFVSGAIALNCRTPFWRTWKDEFGFSYHFLNCAALHLLGLGLVIAVEVVGSISGLLTLAILLVLRDGYRVYARARVSVARI